MDGCSDGPCCGCSLTAEGGTLVDSVRHEGGLDAFFRPGEGKERSGCEWGILVGSGAPLRLRFRVEVGRREGKWVGEDGRRLASHHAGGSGAGAQRQQPAGIERR
jgi:hypothetical protein